MDINHSRIVAASSERGQRRRGIRKEIYHRETMQNGAQHMPLRLVVVDREDAQGGIGPGGLHLGRGDAPADLRLGEDQPVEIGLVFREQPAEPRQIDIDGI